MSENKDKPWLFGQGNDWWNRRAKHGRDKLFETPDLLREAAAEYFDYCQKNPLLEVDFKGSKDITEVVIPRVRPFTLSGLCIYLGASRHWWNEFKKNPNLTKDFLEVIHWIEETIWTQKFEAAAAGFLNTNIIARDLGLVDKKEQEIKTDKPLIIDWTGSSNQAQDKPE
jgi:hypothetical protein